MRTLSIEASFRVPLAEVSGLAVQRVAGRAARLLAVGDESFAIASADLNGGSPGAFTLHDVRRQLEDVSRKGGPKKGGSQWEAIACDSAGRVLVLQESPGAVFVLDADLKELVATVSLDGGDLPAGRAWRDDARSRGEGLALLQGGHLLVVKEKNPPQLLELGPRGAATGHVVPGGEAPFVGHAGLVALACWTLDPADARHLDDLSDMAVGPDGAIYLLSDQARCLCRLSPLAPGGGAVGITEKWQLPGKIEKPEGLVILDDLRPMVVVDRADEKKSLFLLEALG